MIFYFSLYFIFHDIGHYCEMIFLNTGVAVYFILFYKPLKRIAPGVA